MARIRKAQGGSGIGRYWWPEEDPVCDVPEELARDLLANPEWGYSREPHPEPEREVPESRGEGEVEEKPPAEAGSGQGEGTGGEQEKPPAKAPVKPAARTRKTTT